MKKVSIVIPVYNAEKYLHQCLDSMIDQTYKNIEIICVNDGSTDHSLDILNEYAKKDPRVRVFSKENEGMEAATSRNMGRRKATGDYIQFIDSDDYVDLHMVEEMVTKAEETDADICFCWNYNFDNNTNEMFIRNEENMKYVPDKDPFTYKDCNDRIYEISLGPITWNKLYRLSFLNEHHLEFPKIAIADDMDLSLLGMVYAKAVTCVKKPFVYYRTNTGSSQVDKVAKFPEIGYKAYEKIITRLKSEGRYEEVKKSFINLSVETMRWFFDSMKSLENTKLLYNEYRNNTFKFVGAENATEDMFFDRKVWEWYKMMTTKSLEEILFASAKAYGYEATTAITRFALPKDSIPKNSRVLLVGKGRTGRLWYSQLILSGWAEVVAWIDDDEALPDQSTYDFVLEAKSECAYPIQWGE